MIIFFPWGHKAMESPTPELSILAAFPSTPGPRPWLPQTKNDAKESVGAQAVCVCLHGVRPVFAACSEVCPLRALFAAISSRSRRGEVARVHQPTRVETREREWLASSVTFCFNARFLLVCVKRLKGEREATQPRVPVSSNPLPSFANPASLIWDAENDEGGEGQIQEMINIPPPITVLSCCRLGHHVRSLLCHLLCTMMTDQASMVKSRSLETESQGERKLEGAWRPRIISVRGPKSIKLMEPVDLPVRLPSQRGKSPGGVGVQREGEGPE